MDMVRIATVFSGIGAFEQALEKLNIPYEIVFACDTGERYVDFNFEDVASKTNDLSNKKREKIIRNLYDLSKKRNATM